AFLKITTIGINRCFVKSKLLVTFLIHEVKTMGVAIEKRRRRELNIRLGKLLAGTETLFQDGTSQELPQARSHHRRSAAGRRRCKENLQHHIRLPVNRDQEFSFQFVSCNQRHSVDPPSWACRGKNFSGRTKRGLPPSLRKGWAFPQAVYHNLLRLRLRNGGAAS